MVKELRDLGSQVEYMPYQGWVIIRLSISKKTAPLIKIFYNHGNFHGQVSLGTQAIRRYAAVAPDADVFISGDNHERWNASHAVYKLNHNFDKNSNL